MQTRQTILIIGAGCTGKALAKALLPGNFQLLLCDKEYPSAVKLAGELEQAPHNSSIEAMECTFDSAWEADLVVLAVQEAEQIEVAALIRDVVNQKIVVSSLEPVDCPTGNTNGHSNCREALQALLPHTKVVKVTTGDGPGTQTDFNLSAGVILSGQDESAIEVVASLLTTAGIAIKRKEQVASTNH